MNKKKVDQFWEKRTKVTDPVLATHYKYDNAINYDVQLVKKHILSEKTKVLDLGCGTGRTIEHLEPIVDSITAVDKQQAFLDQCIQSHKVKTVLSSVESYMDNDKYDIILLFGVVNFLTYEETKQLYRNCSKMLKDNGVLIVKHTCGIEEDVLIDTFSEQLQEHYHAEYRQFNREKELMVSAGFSVELIDIYPPELNPWENTHFYAFVCHLQ